MGPDGAQRSCLPTFYLFQLTTGLLSRTLLLPDPKPGMLHSHFRGFYQMAGFPGIVYAWCLGIHTDRGKGRASQLRKHAMPHRPFVYQGGAMLLFHGGIDYIGSLKHHFSRRLLVSNCIRKNGRRRNTGSSMAWRVSAFANHVSVHTQRDRRPTNRVQ